MDSKKKKILVVDADDKEREQLVLKLVAAGYDVLPAKDGAEAFNMAQQNPPDLIISDVVMPAMDGGQLFKKLHEVYFGKNIPFVVLTTRENMRDYFETMGVSEFITKPCLPENLLGKIQRVLIRPRPTAILSTTKKALVAGNDTVCVDDMMGLLKKEGCHTDCVPFSEQIISKAVLFLPHVFILEASMPGMLVEENVRVLRHMPQFKKAPILIYNFYQEAKLKKEEVQQKEINLIAASTRCLEAGATEYIGKFEPETFVAHVGRYLKKATIVVIDDDPVMAQLLKMELTKEGYRVEAAPDGEKGVELIKKVRPHLILLDVLLPGMIGYDVLGKIKSDSLTKDIPVMMMTVKSDDGAIQKALDLGVEDYIVKPFHMGLLKRRVQAWVSDLK